jgi:hypothetical protein
MAAIEFEAQVTNGAIEIPPVHRAELQGSVHVIVIPAARAAGHSMIDELLAHPLQVTGFRPLTRDQAHER